MTAWILYKFSRGNICVRCHCNFYSVLAYLVFTNVIIFYLFLTDLVYAKCLVEISARSMGYPEVLKEAVMPMVDVFNDNKVHYVSMSPVDFCKCKEGIWHIFITSSVCNKVSIY